MLTCRKKASKTAISGNIDTAVVFDETHLGVLTNRGNVLPEWYGLLIGFVVLLLYEVLISCVDVQEK